MLVIPQYGLAQPPRVSIYFDDALSRWWGMCPPDPPGVIFDSLYVVAEDFSALISQIEYKVNYEPAFLWLYDLAASGTAEGNTDIGIIQSWENPQDASTQLLLNKVFVLWMCSDCGSGNTDIMICVDSNPNTGYLRAIRWPDMSPIFPESWAVHLCPTNYYPRDCPITPPVPVEQANWGAIKSFYK